MDINEYNQKIIAEFRENDGVVGGPFAGAKLLLLHSIGAKSGVVRINPLAYFDDGVDLLIVASFSGAAKNPPWYFNLLADANVTVEVGSEKYAAIATELGEPERSEQYRRIAGMSEAFAKYQEKTSRVIPIFRLTKTA